MDFPNLRHLRAFKIVAEKNRVSAAAVHIHLSQPAVTQAISGLEKTLGLALFDRRPEGMFLTPPGQQFLERIQRFFALLEQSARLALQTAAKREPGASSGFYRNVSASQLRALIAIRDTGNFSLAARSIGVSQPSVHRAARDLEKTAGVSFFVASRRGIELTEAAEHFARGANLAAGELRQGYDEIAFSKGRDSARIAIGSMPLSRTTILPDAIDALLQESEGVQLHTVDGPYDELLRSLHYGELDFLIGALRRPAPVQDVVQEVLFHDPLTIVVGPGHPLAGRSGVTLEETLDYPWVAPPKGTPTGSYLYRTAKIGERETTPVRVVSSSLVLVRGLLARGDYVTIMSRHQMAVEFAQGLMVPLDVDLPESTRPIGLTFRQDWMPTPTQERIIDLIREASRGSIEQTYA